MADAGDDDDDDAVERERERATDNATIHLGNGGRLNKRSREAGGGGLRNQDSV